MSLSTRTPRQNKFPIIKNIELKTKTETSSETTSEEQSQNTAGVRITGSGAGDVTIENLNLGNWDLSKFSHYYPFFMIIVFQIFVFLLSYRNFSVTKTLQRILNEQLPAANPSQ